MMKRLFSAKYSLRAFVLLCTIALLAAPAGAQEFRAAITGTVTDQQGAVIPGATIKAVNLQTNIATTTTSNQAGVYLMPYLPVGVYQLTVSAQGFKNAVRDKVQLRTGDRDQIDFQMQIGAMADQVTVTAEAPLLEAATASKGQVIDAAKVRDLPLLGRNPFRLVMISTGATITPTNTNKASAMARPFDNGGMDGISINGGRGWTNEFLIDGAANTNVEGGTPASLAFVPSPDATEEFRVQTNSYDAQYGRTGGGTISVSLKSGTNKPHGNIYWYARNDIFNAKSFETNMSGGKKDLVRWAQPGAQFDGPVYIPKLYDGRNRTFFMYSWEKIKSSIPEPKTQTVPTAEQRNGDFSKTLQANGQVITVYDPLTTTGTGGQYTRQPFAGNRVPADRIDPVAAKLLSYIAQPNAPGNAQGFYNLVVSPNPRTDEYDQHVIRIDQVVNDKHKFFGRYVRGNRHEVRGLEGWQRDASPAYAHWRINQGGGFDLTSVFSPTLVSSFRASFIRHQFAIARYADGFDPAKLGFPQSLTSQIPRPFFPRINYTDYTSFGNTGSQFTFSDTWDFSETLTKVVGSHSLKFGGEMRVMRNNQQNPTSSFGTFSFSRGFTQRDPLRGDAASGNAFAALLLGYPESGNVPYQVAPAYQSLYYAAYLQDDWRVTRKLTLNLGLRWDYESPMSERYNQMNRGFDATASNPFQVPGLQLKGGLLFADENQRLPYRRDLNNFQPRVGVAYRIDDNTVLRGGYGPTFLPTFDTGYNNGFSLSTSYVASVDGGITPSGKLANPYPNGIDRPPGKSQGLATLVGRGFTYGYPDRVIPYIHQFSAGIQRQLPWHLLVDASYVGSRTGSLGTSKGINENSAADLARGAAYLLETVPNPFKGLLPGTAFNDATVPRQQLIRSYPQFTGITEGNRTIGTAWYNSLQLRVEKRLSQGFHLLLSYTLSKSMEAISYLNPQDQFGQLERRLMEWDQPQRLVISGGYELPIFKKSANRLLKTAFGGWQLNAIGTLDSGVPIPLPSGVYSTGLDPALSREVQNRQRWFNTCTLTLTGGRQSCVSASEAPVFAIQPPYTLRTLSTRFPNVRTARPLNVDFSVFKAFPIREGINLQLRAESFNIANTPWFGPPSTSVNSAAFGTVSPTQFNDPRNIQLALKLMF